VQGVRLLREIAVDLRPRRHAEEAQAPPRGKRTPGTEINRESNSTHTYCIQKNKIIRNDSHCQLGDNLI